MLNAGDPLACLSISNYNVHEIRRIAIVAASAPNNIVSKLSITFDKVTLQVGHVAQGRRPIHNNHFIVQLSVSSLKPDLGIVCDPNFESSARDLLWYMR